MNIFTRVDGVLPLQYRSFSIFSPVIFLFTPCKKYCFGITPVIFSPVKKYFLQEVNKKKYRGQNTINLFKI